MIVATEIILVALALVASPTVQDSATKICEGVTTTEMTQARTTIDVPLPSGKEPTDNFPVKVSCGRNYKTKNVYTLSIESCTIAKPWVFIRSGYRACRGAFFVDGQLYGLSCNSGRSPSIELLPAEEFSSSILACSYDDEWQIEVPVVGAKQVFAMSVYFDRPTANFKDFAKCSPFGPASEYKGVKAGQVAVFVKDKSTYELKCFKNETPELREADFLKEMCNDKKNEAIVEVTGDQSPDKRVTSMCVSFSCNKEKTEIKECKADCRVVGGGIKAEEAKVVTKDGKKFDFTCKKTEPPTIAFKKA